MQTQHCPRLQFRCGCWILRSLGSCCFVNNQTCLRHRTRCSQCALLLLVLYPGEVLRPAALALATWSRSARNQTLRCLTCRRIVSLQGSSRFAVGALDASPVLPLQYVIRTVDERTTTAEAAGAFACPRAHRRAAGRKANFQRARTRELPNKLLEIAVCGRSEGPRLRMRCVS